MELNIRCIEPSDDPIIARIIRTVLEEHGVDRPGTVYTDPTTDHLSTIFNEQGSTYWIAELNGKMVGGCGIYPTKGLPNKCVELVKLYVLKEARGKQIGQALIQKSIESARELGYKEIYLESMPELTKAVSLYERLGFRTITKRLGESGHFACNIWMVMKV